MSIVDDLPNLSQPMQRVWEGEIRSSPTMVNQLINVVIPAFTTDLLFKQCRWTPRFEPIPVNTIIGVDFDTPTAHNVKVTVPYIGKIIFPKIKNPCLCVFDNSRQLWVVMYWPY